MDSCSHNQPLFVAAVIVWIHSLGLLAGDAYGAEPTSLTGHRGKVAALLFTPNGKTLLSAGDNSNSSEVFVWDLKTKSSRSLFPKGEDIQVRAMALSPDRETLAIACGSGVQLWRYNSSKRCLKQPPTNNQVDQVAFSNDPLIVAATEPWGGPGIDILDIREGERVARFVDNYDLFAGPDPCDRANMTFTPDGKLLIAAYLDGNVRIWSAKDKSLQRKMKVDSTAAYSVSCSPDGKSVASCGYDGVAKIWEVASGKEERVLKVEGDVRPLSCIAWSPDGKTIAAGSYFRRSIALWTVSTWRASETFAGPEGFASTLAFSPDGKTLASGGSDKVIRLWEVRHE